MLGGRRATLASRAYAGAFQGWAGLPPNGRCRSLGARGGYGKVALRAAHDGIESDVRGRGELKLERLDRRRALGSTRLGML